MIIFDKNLIVLPATSGGISIISFVSIIGALTEIASASFSLVFFLATGIIKKLLGVTRNKKKQHNKYFMLAKSKLNSIETLIFQALIDLEISHEEFKTIVNEKEKYEKMKESIKMVKSGDESNENIKINKNIRGNDENAQNLIYIYIYIYIYIKYIYIKCSKIVLKHGEKGVLI